MSLIPMLWVYCNYKYFTFSVCGLTLDVIMTCKVGPRAARVFLTASLACRNFWMMLKCAAGKWRLHLLLSEVWLEKKYDGPSKAKNLSQRLKGLWKWCILDVSCL